MAKRVAFFLPDMRLGGAERVALTLIAYFVDHGIDVDLLLMEATGELLVDVPESVRVIDLKAPRIRRALTGLVSYLGRERPDALQVSMWPLTVVGIIAGKLARTHTRVVVSEHVVLSEQYGGSARTMAAMRATLRLFFPLAAARICVSAGVVDDVAGLSGLPSRRFDLVYNPIGAPDHIVTSAAVDSQWGGEGPRILTVGSLKIQKNQALLLDAFARLPDNQARLTILGDGPLRAELEYRVVELDLAGRVAMPGFTNDPWPYYASADLFVLSSDYEGFGNVIVEAMHAGLPIVSTDCSSGPAEILANGEYGDLVPVGDGEALAGAIQFSLSRPPSPDRQKLRAGDFSVEAAASRYLSLLLG